MWFYWWVGLATYKCFGFSVGSIFYWCVGVAPIKLCFLFVLVLQMLGDMTFLFLVVLLMHENRNLEVFSCWCFGIWGLIFISSIDNLFDSMDAWGTTWKLFGFFCCNDAWGFDFQKVLWFLMVLLIQYGDFTFYNYVDAWGNNSPIFWHFGLY